MSARGDNDCRLNQPMPRVILWGGTGQAKVIRPIVEYYGGRVVAVFDDTPDLGPPFQDVPLYEGRRGFEMWIGANQGADLGFCVTIGNPHGRERIRLHEWLRDQGLNPTSFAHPTAWIAEDAIIGAGAQIMAGAIVGVGARLGRECIVNTRASVDHEDVLEDGVEVGPGAILCGLVHVGVNGWVCAGATVLPRIRIGDDATVGAGAVVLRDVAGGTEVIGVPAEPAPRRETNA